MARLKSPDQGLIFASCILNQKRYSVDALKEAWKKRYELSGELLPSFNPSLDYYSNEMGSPLTRLFLWSDLPQERSELVDGKLWADSLEQDTALEGKRVVNVDIGILLKEQVVLSTSKPYSHRIYLNDGVYAELTYTFENKSYHFLPWTYPDYRCPEKVELFNSLRKGLFQK